MAAEKPPEPRWHLKFDLLDFVAVLLAVLMIREALGGAHEQTIPYSEYQQLVDKGEPSPDLSGAASGGVC